MKPRVTRRFGIADALILLAATGVGLAWIRGEWDRYHFWILRGFAGDEPIANRLWSVLRSVGYLMTELILCWSLAMLVIRLRSPRPPRRRLWCQPGFLASSAACSLFLWHCIGQLGASVLGSWLLGEPSLVHGRRSERARAINDIIGFSTTAQCEVSTIILFCWSTLWLGGRLRPEASWIDRIGRGLGVSWVVCHLLIER